MEFKPIQTKKVYEEIIEQIKSLIAERKLRPGDKLISERELAEKMQVGRSAVREAFRALEAMKIIEIKPGEGTFIREASPESIIDALSLVLNAENETARELMELRKILEVECAALAAKRRTDQHIKEMERTLKQMEIDISKGLLGEKSDFAFHYAIARAAGNTMLYKLMATISHAIKHVMRTARAELYRNPSKPKQLLSEHWSVFEAIKASQPEQARSLMLHHLRGVEKEAFKLEEPVN